ncbi:hypothetical protein YSY43_36420 [Paenibacillus sp. YSY-4.3]
MFKDGQYAEHQKDYDQLTGSSIAGSGWNRSYGEFQSQRAY